MTNHSNSGTPLPKVAVVITAAGSSTRMGPSVKKEYLPLGDGTVLSACVKAFRGASRDSDHPFEISHLVITVPKNGTAEAAKAAGDSNIRFVEGGSTRQKSVFNALDHISKTAPLPDYVLIHDGARPFVTAALIQAVVQATQIYDAATPGITPTDTIKGLDKDGFIVTHLIRSSLTAVQTPQGFVFKKLYDAHKKAAGDDHDYTDDSEIWGKYCGKVKLVDGEVGNAKVTYPGDIEKWIAASLRSSQ